MYSNKLIIEILSEWQDSAHTLPCVMVLMCLPAAGCPLMDANQSMGLWCLLS